MPTSLVRVVVFTRDYSSWTPDADYGTAKTKYDTTAPVRTLRPPPEGKERRARRHCGKEDCHPVVKHVTLHTLHTFHGRDQTSQMENPQKIVSLFRLSGQASQAELNSAVPRRQSNQSGQHRAPTPDAKNAQRRRRAPLLCWTEKRHKNSCTAVSRTVNQNGKL